MALYVRIYPPGMQAVVQALSLPEFQGFRVSIAGHSLGGAYAKVLALRWLIASKQEAGGGIWSEVGYFQVFSFGAPLILYFVS